MLKQEKDKETVAKFMGLFYDNSWTKLWQPHIGNTPTEFYNFIIELMISETWYVTELEFNNSWNWLMPVVEKIESLNAAVIIDEDCTIEFGGVYFESTNSMHNCEFETFKTTGTKIEKVFNAIVEFIEWYDKKII